MSTTPVRSLTTPAHSRGNSIQDKKNGNQNEPFRLKPDSHYHPNYPISTVMNQVSSQNITLTAFNAIRSSIPINLKPPPLSSFVKLPYGQQHSVLAPSNKRSAPSPIKLSRSPTIPLSDFDAYLEQVQVHYERWQQNLTTNSKNIKSLHSNHPTDLTINHTSQSAHPTSQAPDPNSTLPSLSSVPNVFFDPKFSLNNPLTFDLLTQQSSQSSPATSSTESDLHLTRPKPSTSLNSKPDLTTDHILLDKLSHYLDLVELHLVQEISLRSSDFFSALGNLQSLHAQTSSSVAQIESLKNQLEQLKQTVSDKALKIIRFGIRRRNITSIELALTKLNDVWQTVHGIEQLIQSGEWQSALGLIQELEQLWHSSTLLSPSTPHDPTDSNQSSASSPARPIKLRLSKIKALAALPKRLSVFRSTISKALVAELSSILSHDLKIHLVEFTSNRHLYQPQSTDSKSPGSSPMSSSNLNGSQSRDQLKGLARERLKERVRSTFDGLIRAGGMDKALAAWREGVVKQIREIVKSALSDVIEGDLDDRDDSSDISQFSSKDKRNALSDKTMSLARNLKALKHEEFLKIAETTYRDLLGCIELIDTQSQALIELTEEFKAQSSPAIHSDLAVNPPSGSNSVMNPPNLEPAAEADQSSTVSAIDVEAFILKLNEVVQASAELANARFAKVIGVRTEVHAQLSFTDFFAIFDASWRFVVQCEVIGRRMIIALRGVMVNQAKAFLQSFHQNRITESAKIVEQEQWSPVEVPSQIQQTVNSIIRSAMEDPKSLVINRNQPNQPVEDKAAGPSLSSKLLEIEGTFYHPVSASLQTMNTIADYLQVVVNCSLLTTDLMGKIIEFLKAFNSRTCQVVLGAGAIRSAGLKNITAKHLALASQALSTMISLIPYIRECLRRHLNMKQAVMLVDFDKLKRDYQEHQNEVHAKLISIMAERLGIHKQTLETIDWESSENASSDPATAPNAYLESLLKEVGTLHRVLGRYLSSSTLQDILSQVFRSIHGALHEEFSRVEVKSIQAKQRILGDAQYFSTKLVELKASEECQASGKSLEDLVRTRFFSKEAGTKEAKGSEVKSPDATEFPLPPSPLTERTSSFRAKFRFLSPRGRAAEPPASLLTEITNAAAASSVTEEQIGSGAVSPAGSVVVETEAETNLDKPVDTSAIPVRDSSLDDSAGEAKAEVHSEQPRIPLNQRLAALASFRRGSQNHLQISPAAESPASPTVEPPAAEPFKRELSPVGSIVVEPEVQDSPEITNAAVASSVNEEQIKSGAVSPAGSVVVETEAETNLDKPVDTSAIPVRDSSLDDSAGEAKAEVHSEQPRIPLNQRLAALASFRRGSQNHLQISPAAESPASPTVEPPAAEPFKRELSPVGSIVVEPEIQDSPDISQKSPDKLADSSAADRPDISQKTSEEGKEVLDEPPKIPLNQRLAALATPRTDSSDIAHQDTSLNMIEKPADSSAADPQDFSQTTAEEGKEVLDEPPKIPLNQRLAALATLHTGSSDIAHQDTSLNMIEKLADSSAADRPDISQKTSEEGKEVLDEPPKIPLNQRLAALASKRRGSQNSS